MLSMLWYVPSYRYVGCEIDSLSEQQHSAVGRPANKRPACLLLCKRDLFDPTIQLRRCVFPSLQRREQWCQLCSEMDSCCSTCCCRASLLILRGCHITSVRKKLKDLISKCKLIGSPGRTVPLLGRIGYFAYSAHSSHRTIPHHSSHFLVAPSVPTKSFTQHT